MVSFLFFICILITSQDGAEALRGTVYFDAGACTLTSQSDTVLKGIADELRAAPNLMIDIYGYTDNVGGVTANNAISKERADLVKQTLAEMLGEHGDRIQTFGMGSKNPRASNSTEEGRKKNRRAEIMIREPDAVLTWFDHDVRVQPPFLRPRWLDPTPDYYLYHDYVVTTGKASSAHIQYPNESVLKMDEDAMVIIHRTDDESRDDLFIKNITVENGSLEAMLDDKTGQPDSTATITDVDHKQNSLNQKNVVDNKLKDLIAAYEGDTAISIPQEKPKIEYIEEDIGPAAVKRERPAGFGAGVFAGDPAGVSLKGWIDGTQAADVEIGWSYPDEIVYVVGDYLIHFPDLEKHPRWYPYLGIGVQLRIDKNDGEWQFDPGLRCGVGIEYIYRRFGLFAELYPVVELIPRTPVSIAGGIGIRYYITD
jgi:hypothetical protein